MSEQRHGDLLARAGPVQLGDATLAALRPVAVPVGSVLFHAGAPVISCISFSKARWP